MPRYVKQGRKENSFRKKYPKHNLKQAQSLLARLNHEEFQVVQEVAQHFQGNRNMFSPHLPDTHSKKIKPSSYGYIVGARNPYDFGQALQLEKHAHDSHHIESHMGGGLLEAFNVVGNYVWELYNPMPEAAKWAIDKMMHRDQSRKMDKIDRQNADLLVQAYKNVGDRGNQVDNFKRIPELDTEYCSAWIDPNGNVSVAIRGSKTLQDWMYHDPQIAVKGRPGQNTTDSIQDYLVQVAQAFPEADITVNSHSLSGSFVQHAFQDATPEQAEWLDHYTRINQYNPGASPFVATDDIKEFSQDPRVYLYLNRTDMISSAYNAVIPSDYNRVSFGDPSYSPVEAHSIAQWGSSKDNGAQHSPQLVDKIGELVEMSNFQGSS